MLKTLEYKQVDLNLRKPFASGPVTEEILTALKEHDQNIEEGLAENFKSVNITGEK